MRTEIAAEREGVGERVEIVLLGIGEIVRVDDRRRLGIGGIGRIEAIVPRERGAITAAEMWKRQPLPPNGREAMG